MRVLSLFNIAFCQLFVIDVRWISLLEQLDMSYIAKLKLPIILIIALLIPLLLDGHVSYHTKAFFYSVSLTLKSVLITVLPFLIFSFVFYCLVSRRQGVLFFVVLLIGMVFCSNLLAIMVSYAAGVNVIPSLHLGVSMVKNDVLTLHPLWQLTIPQLIRNEQGLLAGFICGLFFSVRPHPYAERFAKRSSQIANLFLKKLFIPTLPFFILGFAFKLEQEQMLISVTQNYGRVLCFVLFMQASYMFMLYYIASGFVFKKCIFYIRNMFAAMITAFTTISSAATMPVTMMCTEKNIGDRAMAETIIPATASIHTLGSAIGLTALALTTLLSFGKPLPGLMEFSYFAVIYALAKFAVAGVPGGVVIVVAPLLEAHLGFSGEMAGVITAIYLLFDPFGTMANVTGNGAFAIILAKILKRNTASAQKNSVI